MGSWPLGIANRVPEDAMPTDDDGNVVALRAARNVDIDDAGKVRRRPGATLALERAGLHSVWATDRFPFLLGVDATGIVAMDESEDMVAVGAALERPDLPMAWDHGANRVFASNGYESTEILPDGSRRPWAVEQPSGQPLAAPSASVGGLDKGTYQVAVTFLDIDGRESGSTLPVEVELAQNQGITLSNFPQALDPRTAMVRVYCSAPNGDVLRWAQDLPLGLSSFTLGNHTPGKPLETLFLTTLPPCTALCVHGGRLYGARRNLLVWSEPLNYGLTRRAGGYQPYDGDVTLVARAGEAESAGLYVVTAAAGGRRAGRTYFLTGPRPGEWQRVVAHTHGAVPGSMVRVSAKALRLEAPGDVPVWLTDNGQIVAGLPGGQVIELHEANYAAPERAERAAIALRTVDGMRHLIASLRGGQASSMGSRDVAEAEVWKNGERIS